jgi:hypothetical protein
MALMMSMPFEFGFVNERWTKAIDVMLEKKKGVRKIHMLRIIALLEADFDTMMFNAETAGLNDEQWGSRKNRMALDPALRNMMIFEYGRYMRVTVAMFAADLTACFDRMFPAISNILAEKIGVEVYRHFVLEEPQLMHWSGLFERGMGFQKLHMAIAQGNLNWRVNYKEREM